jgi:hypothetical protein
MEITFEDLGLDFSAPDHWLDIQDFNVPIKDDVFKALFSSNIKDAANFDNSEKAIFLEIVKKLRSLAKVKFKTLRDLIDAEMELIDKVFGTYEDGEALHALNVLVKLDKIGAINTPEAFQMLKALESLGELEALGEIKSYQSRKDIVPDETFAFRYTSIFRNLEHRSWHSKTERTETLLRAALDFAELILEVPLDIVAMQNIYKTNGREGGLISGASRADNANKPKVVEAWHAWQKHPECEPYGNKRGCKARFDEAMIKTWDVNPETVRKWRVQLQNAAAELTA